MGVALLKLRCMLLCLSGDMGGRELPELRCMLPCLSGEPGGVVVLKLRCMSLCLSGEAGGVELLRLRRMLLCLWGEHACRVSPASSRGMEYPLRAIIPWGSGWTGVFSAARQTTVPQLQPPARSAAYQWMEHWQCQVCLNLKPVCKGERYEESHRPSTWQ